MKRRILLFLLTFLSIDAVKELTPREKRFLLSWEFYQKKSDKEIAKAFDTSQEVKDVYHDIVRLIRSHDTDTLELQFCYNQAYQKLLLWHTDSKNPMWEVIRSGNLVMLQGFLSYLWKIASVKKEDLAEGEISLNYDLVILLTRITARAIVLRKPIFAQEVLDTLREGKKKHVPLKVKKEIFGDDGNNLLHLAILHCQNDTDIAQATWSNLILTLFLSGFSEDTKNLRDQSGFDLKCERGFFEKLLITQKNKRDEGGNNEETLEKN